MAKCESSQSQIKYTKPKPNAYCFTTIPVHDLARAKSFYATAFDWVFRPIPSDTIAVFHTPGELMGALHIKMGEAARTATDTEHPEFRAVNYVLVEDVDATLKKIVEAG